jgi:hypothetical protein
VSIVVLISLAFSAAAAPAAFVELAGSGGLGSFDLAYPLGERVDLRVGISALPVDRNVGLVLIFPVLAEFHTVERWRLVGGAGLGPSISTHGVPWARGLLEGGARYVPPDGHLWAGLAWTPFVPFLLDLQLEQWAGLQLGWRP